MTRIDRTETAIIEAIRHTRVETAEIARLCYIAGRVDLAPAMIRDGVTVEQAHQVLEDLAAAAAQQTKPAAHNGHARFDPAAIEAALRERGTTTLQ